MSNQNHLSQALDEAPMGLFHLRAVLTAGAGFFTDAYDLFIIGAALVLIKGQWHLSKEMVGLLGSTSLIAAFLGAFIFGRISDVFGRKKVYGLEAAIMAIGAVLSALSPNILWLLVFRFIMGLGIGGDYPVSAVLMSEYANRKDRGKLVSLVFSMQALGLIAGPIVAMTLLASGVDGNIAWRIMLGLGAIPALAVIYFRRTMPESPRFEAQVRGQVKAAAENIRRFSGGAIVADQEATPSKRMNIWKFISNRRLMLTLLGTAGTWFLFDYAYYGNSISTPLIMKLIAPHASALTAEAWSLMIFAIAAVPGYILAFTTIDKIGHKKLQLIGFFIMGLAFLLMGIIPGITTMVGPFLVLYAISYFFAEFGPNTTTFVLSAELFPVSVRTTGHGFSAGIAKIGAFIGAFLFPVLSSTLGLAGTLDITFVFALLGIALTMLLPEPSGKSLDALSDPTPNMPTDPQLRAM
ncbi:MFS transporter [Sulfoacidibacillus thermotolerans]|uniref:MFS transporter n=1 Tax=Sulfoacidibacillus thermotolerans TaxID=1765684 RepID=A0A2U3DBC9_SULT2|nr:MFS transporter [Sulfoacidibacillus thermotolerans]PWI58589.1 MFS transporter [Sulfoacidibacillus thermotolerans]